jgi:hypothetical protein
VRIFLSWSGERSRAVAQSLRDWLPLILYYAQPWFSERDVDAGERWAIEIGHQLEGSQFGIIILTSDNLSAPWLLFEAGALSKAFTAGAVAPYLIDIDFKDISGPLSQFQAKKAVKPSTFELISAINSKAAQPIDANRLSELFDVLWPKLDERLRNLPGLAVDPKPRAQAQVLEDLVSAVRRMEARFDRLPTVSSIPSARLDLTETSENARIRLVTVRVDGGFPGLEAGVVSFTFAPGNDFIEDIAAHAGVPLEQYGIEWHVTSAKNRQPLSRESGVALLRASSNSIAVALRRGAA